jgi:calcium/calmodulin-dependent protein kinase I
MLGYGKEADLWSVGVIMFLVLCGKLPFDGDDHNEIIRSTILGELKVNPAIWSKLSEDARSLITALLNKSPKERISAKDALRHPFITSNCPHHRRTVSSASETSPSASMIGGSPRVFRTVYHSQYHSDNSD